MDKFIKIRAYTSDDKKLLIALLEQNTPSFFAEEEINDFVEYLNSHIDHYFVIEYKSNIVGCGGYNLFEDHAKISWDIINPQYQGKGLGKLLLAYRIQQLKESQSIEQIFVRTSQYVYPFYESNGFVLEEIKANYWAEGYDLYKLTMRL